MNHASETPGRRSISTSEAPAAIGPYSQAVAVGDLVFLSGQIPLDPKSMTIVPGGIVEQTRQVFTNLQAVARAAGGALSDLVKITIYLKDLAHFQTVNSVMEEYFTPPFPARAALGVADLPRGADVEVEGIMHLFSGRTASGRTASGETKIRQPAEEQAPGSTSSRVE